jgi:ABC-type glutathione transport system ATPase component
MVMVTHDVGLKSFAERIIWMRDGRIQRIEIVPKEKKREAIRRNEEDLKELRRKKKKKIPKSNQIEYRIPTDYVTHQHYEKRGSFTIDIDLMSSFRTRIFPCRPRRRKNRKEEEKEGFQKEVPK